MCRNIKRLHNVDPPVTGAEVRDAALQFVRKVSGRTRPARANAAAFERAVEEIAAASERLLAALGAAREHLKENDDGRARNRSAGGRAP